VPTSRRHPPGPGRRRQLRVRRRSIELGDKYRSARPRPSSHRYANKPEPDERAPIRLPAGVSFRCHCADGLPSPPGPPAVHPAHAGGRPPASMSSAELVESGIRRNRPIIPKPSAPVVAMTSRCRVPASAAKPVRTGYRPRQAGRQQITAAGLPLWAGTFVTTRLNRTCVPASAPPGS